jgi:hypothetical protein
MPSTGGKLSIPLPSLSRRPLSAEAQINLWPVHVGFVVTKETPTQVFLRIFWPSAVCPTSGVTVFVTYTIRLFVVFLLIYDILTHCKNNLNNIKYVYDQVQARS